MKRSLGAVGVILLGSGLFTDCSSSSIPAGVMNGLDSGGGGVACGPLVCAAGQLCCPGTDALCSPTCMSVAACPTLGRSCPIPDAGGEPGADAGPCAQSDCANLPMEQLAKVCPDGSTLTANLCARQSDGRCNWTFPACPAFDASAEASTSDAGGACCPANWSMYDCTYSDGGKGLACHNPALGCVSSSICGQGCDPVVTGRCGSPTLQWYTTCGYPVCRTDVDGGSSDGGPACPMAGTACSTIGDTCGTPSNANCGVTIVCSDHDPKAPFSCPMSSRKYKNGIEYLDETGLERLHDDTLRIKLATYKYKSNVANPDPTHLGFIIEDNPQSPAVDSTRERIDLYGYVSMVVATMQVQEKEIAALRKELDASRRSAASCPTNRK